MKNKLIILGMGNTLLGDDGIGIYIVKELEKRIPAGERICYEYTSWGGFRVIDILQNFETAIVIDAINTHEKPEGYIHVLNHETLLHSIRMVSYHDINFASALKLAEIMEIPMPGEIFVYGIEVRKIGVFGKGISYKAKIAAEKCVELLIERINELNNNFINHKTLQPA